MPQQRGDRGVDALALQILADDRAHEVPADDLELRQPGGLQRR